MRKCRQCGGGADTDAQWCSKECEKAWRWAAQAYTDEVRGVIIGGQDRTYEFWPKPEHERLAKWTWIARGCFPNDEEAVAWFREQYPEWFARGVEMRVR